MLAGVSAAFATTGTLTGSIGVRIVVSMNVVLPLVSLASVVVIALGYRWLRGLPLSKGLVSAGFGLIAFVGAGVVVGWAGEDPSRLAVVLVLVVAMATFTIYEAHKRRPM